MQTAITKALNELAIARSALAQAELSLSIALGPGAVRPAPIKGKGLDQAQKQELLYRRKKQLTKSR